MWTLQRSGNVNFLFFPSLNVVHCSQTWVFVFCSNSVFLPIFGKMMGFGAKICRRRAKAAQRKCSQALSALFRKRKTSFLAFCLSFLVFLCMIVITGALKYPNLVHTLIKKGFCSPRWLLQANCLFSTQLFVFCLFTTPIVCLLFLFNSWTVFSW